MAAAPAEPPAEMQKYREEWEKEFAWLHRVQDDALKAGCSACGRDFSISHGGVCDVKQHAAGEGHVRSIRIQNRRDGFLQADGSPEADETLRSSGSSLEIKVEKNDEATVEDGPGNSGKTFRFSNEPTLEDISLQTAFAAERGWGKYHQPRNLLLALVGEVGEVAELFQWRAEAPEGLPGWTDPDREALSDELSDVLIYLVALADKCRVDLPSAALRKMEKNRLKYPAEKVYGSSKKYTEYQE
ncbi:dCTP pyrophosphatase 1 isoform X2 [Sphaerodactylus townsendi]|uniref:dCTP pyrophosphatase 1 isoform X2 n=1 Tax=Sphaerodactylus townsendi TaxID=933632 RepID=UPI0020271D4A|nr:dCTP pyrophosphatase 1 isoform X2 [Sphaerodactylus townsendi]